MIATPSSTPPTSSLATSPPEIECPSCRRVTSLERGVEGLAVNYATQDVITGLEDDSSYRSAFSWPNSENSDWQHSAAQHSATPRHSATLRNMTERKKAPSEIINKHDIAYSPNRMHRRSLSCPGACLATMAQDGQPAIVTGDGWEATLVSPKTIQAFATPSASPFALKPMEESTRQKSSPIRENTREPFTPNTLPKAIRERSMSEFAIPNQVSPRKASKKIPSGRQEGPAAFGESVDVIDLRGTPTRERSQTERSSAWETTARRQAMEHVQMMLKAEESLQLAEAMQVSEALSIAQHPNPN